MMKSGFRAVISLALSLIAGVLLLGSWSITLQAAGLSDDEYEQRLVGTWWAKSPHKHDKSVLVYGEVAYTPDGMARAVMLYHRKDEGGQFRPISQLLMIGRWKVEGGILITYDVTSLPKDPELEGWVSRDRILEIGEDKAVLQNLEDGEVYERFKKKGDGA